MSLTYVSLRASVQELCLATYTKSIYRLGLGLQENLAWAEPEVIWA